MMKTALVALLCAIVNKEVAGRPLSALPLYLSNVEDIRSSGGLYEFEDATSANGFLYRRRERSQSTTTSAATRSFLPPKKTDTKGPVNAKMQPKRISSVRPTSTRIPSPSVAPPPPPPRPTSCFPGPDISSLAIPSTPATASSLKDWWCPQQEEYAFMGFSYSVAGCPSKAQMTTDFKNMRQKYSSRYVRIYSNCDWNDNIYNDIVDAASEASIGVYSLVWFGWDDPNAYIKRMSSLIRIIKTNPRAPYVIRNVVIGSEPLFDYAVEPDKLAELLASARNQSAQYGMQVAISEMPWGYQTRGGAPQVVAQQDMMQLNVLPFFDGQATTGDKAWGIVQWSIEFAQQIGTGKPIRLTQTGWPSNDSVWKANSPNGVASLASEKAYFDLLDRQCWYFKQQKVGWFAHIYDDGDLPGWGILQNGQTKFSFNPRTSC